MQLTCRHQLYNNRHSWLRNCALQRFVLLATISVLSAALPRILAQDIPIESGIGTVFGARSDGSIVIPAGATTTGTGAHFTNGKRTGCYKRCANKGIDSGRGNRKIPYEWNN